MRYGTANPWPLPVIYAPASDTTLTAGSETLAITTTSALVGVPGMSYVPVIWGCAAILMGSSAATALVLAARYNGGSDFATMTIAPAVLANSATLMVPLMLIGAQVDAAADGTLGGAAIEITGLATTHDATWKKVGTAIQIMLIPGMSS